MKEDKVIELPGMELHRLKTFRRPWVMWLYCKLWLPIKYWWTGEDPGEAPNG